MIDALRLRSPISSSDARSLNDITYRTREMHSGSYLVREGEVPDHCGVLLAGTAIRHKVMSNGSRQIVAFLVPGDIMDLPHLYLNYADHNVQMLSAATVATFPRTALSDLSRTIPTIGHALLVTTLAEGSILREWIVNIGRRDARARIAHFLCEFGVRMCGDGIAVGHSFSLPFTQEQIGDALGLTAVHVNRTMKALRNAGLISRDDRNLHFPDWIALKEVSGFNPSYLHLTQQVA